MDIDKIGLEFDSAPMKRGVDSAIGELDKFINKLGSFEKSLLALRVKDPTGDLQGPLAQMRQMYDSQIDLINKALLEARTKIAAGNITQLELVREQNQAVQKLYEARLATQVQIHGEELAEWKKHGVNLGNLQRATYEGWKADQKAQAAEELALQKAKNDTALAIAKQAGQQFREIQKAQAAATRAEADQESARYQAALKSMAESKADADARYVAMRKDSLDRGNVLIVQATKQQLAGEAAAVKLAAEQESARYQATLQKMAADKADADARYVALRKDSLSRGSVLIIQAAKQQLAGEATAAKLAADQESARYQATLKSMADSKADADARYVALRKDSLARGRVLIMQAAKLGLEAEQARRPPITPPDVDKLSDSLRRLALDGRDVHSAMRGLASGFNLLWLTWGNLAPLFAGAAISNGFMQTAKTGAAVASTMETIAVLGGNTREEMVALNDQLIMLSRSGPVGPLAVADAMKVLSLAGLKANEILAVTADVLHFSISGTTDLKTAADTLMSVSTAFGMGASGFGRVADVITAAAAESKASVESFSGAMKTASVVHKQYGVSLEDVATAIAALTQLGIDSTAAGTAVRNMYADLSGRSKQVAKVLEEQGIKMRDAAGNFKPLIQVVADLDAHLKKLDPTSAKNLMGALLSERGAKGMVETLDMFRTATKNVTGEVSNALEALQQKITESYGISAISAARMSQTVEAQFASVKANLQASFVEAYQSIEPTLLLIADELKKLFSSPEFITGLGNMVTMVAQLALSFARLTQFVTEHIEAITLAVGAYAAIRGGLTLVATATEAATATTVANTAATVANTEASAANAAAKASGLLGVARLLPGVGTAITVAAGAWMLYDYWVSKSKDTSEAAANLYTNNVIKNLKDEADRLQALNDLRAQGLSLSEAQASMDSQKARKAATDPMREATNAAIREAAKAQDLLAFYQEKHFDKKTISIQEGVVATLLQKVAETKKAENAALDEYEAQVARIKAERKREADAMQAEAAQRMKSLTSTFGTGKFDLATKSHGVPSSTTKGVESAATDYAAQIKKQYDLEEAAFKKANDNKLADIDAMHRAGLLSEAEYQAQLLKLTTDSETAYHSILSREADAVFAANTRTLDAMEAAHSQALLQIKNSATMSEADKVAAMKAENQKYFLSIEAFLQKEANSYQETADKIEALEEKSLARRKKTLYELQGEAKKAGEAVRLAWAEAFADLDAKKAKLELDRENIGSVSTIESQVSEAGKLADIESNKRITTINLKYKDFISKLEETRNALAELYGLNSGDQAEALAAMPQEARAQYELLQSAIAATTKEMESNQAQAARYKEVNRDIAESAEKLKIVKAAASDVNGVIQPALDSWLAGTKSFKEALDDALVSLRDLATQKLVLDPFKKSVGGAIESGTSYLFDLFGFGSSSGGGSSAPSLSGQSSDVLALLKDYSFAGGGYTGSGSRSGGIDGIGGFPAILHPNESVIDHTKGQSIGASTTQVVINNYSASKATAVETTDSRGNRRVEVTIGEMVAAELRRPGSPVNSAVRGAFNTTPALVGR